MTKLSRRSLLTLASAGVAVAAAKPSAAQGWFTKNLGVQSEFFSPQYYANMNADLLRAGLWKYSQLRWHWDSFGKKEGRTGHPLFHARSYAARYPDLQAAFGSNYTALYNHYVAFGQYEGRNARESTLKAAVLGDVSIAASYRQAGAVDSLFFSGMESINSFDHGRQLQAACSENTQQSCYNPTQAGSREDGLKSTSTSQLLLSEVTDGGTRLHTRTKCAYWAAPGETIGDAGVFACTSSVASPLSEFIVDTSYHLKEQGDVTRIDYDMSWTLGRDFPVYEFSSEITTGYHTPDFMLAWEVVPEAGYTARARHQGDHKAKVGQEHPYPVILSTQDGARAIGVYAPQVADAATRYACWAWDFEAGHETNDSAKWSIIRRWPDAKTKGQVISATAVFFVGHLHAVHAALAAHMRANG